MKDPAKTVRALLALSESSNFNERKIAYSKAINLIRQYRLEEFFIQAIDPNTGEIYYLLSYPE